MPLSDFHSRDELVMDSLGITSLCNGGSPPDKLSNGCFINDPIAKSCSLVGNILPVDKVGNGHVEPSGTMQMELISVSTPCSSQLDNDSAVRYVPNEGESRCGWGTFTPGFLQVFNTPRGALFFLCCASLLQGMVVNGLVNTVITSIERRFDMHSYQSGLIASTYDIASCSFLALVSYFGGTGHKPRWLGTGVLFMALGSFTFAMPHFISPLYTPTGVSEHATCAATLSNVNASFAHATGTCQGPSSDLSRYRYIFMLGQFLHGAGATPLYTLGVTYLDENVKTTCSSVYIGTFYTAAILGPAVGYFLGGISLMHFTNPRFKVLLNPESTQWVGAWWVGFLVAGAATGLISIPIAGFPRHLPGSERYMAMQASRSFQSPRRTKESPKFSATIRDLPRAAATLLQNRTFVSLCLAGATEATLISSISTFGPKFLESQFNLSASRAATIFGYLVLPAGGGGTFLGGFVVNRFKLSCQDIIRFCACFAFVCLFCILVFLVQCPNAPFAGITVSYQANSSFRQHDNSSFVDPLVSSCNTNCSCTHSTYNPVCGTDQITYYSPCHAGCRSVYQTHPKTYVNCTCIVANEDGSAVHGQAAAGKCQGSCSTLPLFLLFFFFVIFFTFFCSIPALMATLRCVPDGQRSFALGLQWIVVRALGGIPGPIAFGSFIDRTCQLWQKDCGELGACHLYHNAAMSNSTLLLGISYKLLSISFFLAARWFYLRREDTPSASSGSSDSTDSPCTPQLARTP
uniref:solute carrier organic anion transporter family member 4A1-like n=1 Tax=Myxine glutinosa TaxID=7769 RepID=UPI00358F6865